MGICPRNGNFGLATGIPLELEAGPGPVDTPKVVLASTPPEPVAAPVGFDQAGSAPGPTTGATGTGPLDAVAAIEPALDAASPALGAVAATEPTPAAAPALGADEG